MFEARAGYFYPQSGVMRAVYDDGGLMPGGEFSVRVWEDLLAWVNFSPFWKDGSSEGLESPTSIQIYPLSVGVKYPFELLERFYLYLGVGPSVSWVLIHNDSPYVEGRISKAAWGVVGKSGFIYECPRLVYFNLFADYSYRYLSGISRDGVQSESANVGGLEAGIGIGVRF